MGSPPPMRGKAGVVHVHKHFIRITPAYAGKSSRIPRLHLRERDHPRLCGEKNAHMALITTFGGSPPPMRGKAGSHLQFPHQHRITPAYAGKRQYRQLPLSKSWDHPRLCGEKTKKIPKQRYFFHQPASFSFSLQYT